MQSPFDRPRTYKTEGVVLRHASSGEADRLLTIYTADYGTIRVVPRAVCRATWSRCPTLPFSWCGDGAWT